MTKGDLHMNNQINPNETIYSNMAQNTQFNANAQVSRYINPNQPAQFGNQGAMAQNQPAQFGGQGAVTQIQPNAAFGMPFMQQTDSQMLDYTNLNTVCPVNSDGIASPNCMYTQTNISENFDTGVFPTTQPMPNIVYPNAQPFPSTLYPPLYEDDLTVTDFTDINFAPSPNCVYADMRLECYVGRRVEVQFVMGGTVLDKVGVLRAVDSENLALESEENGNLVIGSLHSVWLVTILQ